MAAEVGERAPGFTLPADAWENTVALEGCEEGRGRVLALSAGSPWPHRAFAADRNIQCPLPAGFNGPGIVGCGVEAVLEDEGL